MIFARAIAEAAPSILVKMAVQKSYFPYEPSKPLAIVAAAVYSLVFAGTLFQFARYRSWVWTVMVLAAGMEAGGYIVRILSVNQQDNRSIYIAQFSLVVLAPVLMAAACYIVFGRIVFHVVPREERTMRLLWVPPRYITPIFVFADIAALFLQLIGAVIITSISVTDPDIVTKAARGKQIAQAGVAVQMICFGLFSFVAVRFHFTSRRFKESFLERLGDRSEKYSTVDGSEKKLKHSWQTLLFVTNFASLMILVRSVYRMIDFTLGRGGYTTTHEWTLYVFDALVILPAVALFVPFHPSKYLPYLGFRLPKHAR